MKCLRILLWLIFLFYVYKILSSDDEVHHLPVPKKSGDGTNGHKQEQPVTPKKPLPSNQKQKHDKWIVVTSAFYSTSQLVQLSRIPGWKLVVVVDNNAPPNWSLDNAIFLDLVSQQELGYKIFQLLPLNSKTRKIIGYLYAIENGAQYIYDTEADIAPDNILTFKQTFVLAKTTRGLIVSNGSTVANPYAHFGQRTVWPRGYPLEQINTAFDPTYTVCQMHTPLVQQGLVNGGPDVDAIFRLTRNKNSSLKIRFDHHAPPMIFPPFVLAPFNSKNTLFHYNAFWSLVLPTSVTGRVTDIWRGYWAQPLLWKIGGYLGFYPSQATRIRDPKVNLVDFGKEDQLYKQANNLTQFLTNWTCSAKKLYPCMLELTEAMANRNYWLRDEIALMQAWITDLQKVGYKKPSFRIRSMCLTDKDKSIAVFNGVDAEALIDQKREILEGVCNSTFTVVKQPVIRFPDTLLIVAFNFPYYENIWLLDLIYRPHYPNILYCGEVKDIQTLSDLMTTRKSVNIKDLSFVHALNLEKGGLIYECVLRAIDMKYNVSGYLLVGDDILLNFWNTINLNYNEMWVQEKIYHRNMDTNIWLHEPKIADRWSGPDLPKTTEMIRSVFVEVMKSDNPHIKNFWIDRERHGLSSSIVGYVYSDIFYVPAVKQEVYYEVGSLLWNNQFFLDFTTALLAEGLSTKNLVTLSGVAVWNSSRFIRSLENFNASAVFLHPVKLSSFSKSPRLLRKYCSKYVSRVLTAVPPP